MASSPKKIVIYQLFTRLFGNQKTTNKPYGTIEENGVGKFSDINAKALKALRNLGISHIWYTGVIEHAVLTDYTEYGIPLDDADVVKGRAGSPYAIKDYYDVNPDLADYVNNRIQEFQDLADRTHKEGLKVLIDFVPNHVARYYHSDQKPSDIIDLGEDDDDTVSFSPQNNFYYLPGQAFQVPEDYNSLGDYDFPTKDGKFDENPAKATGNDQFTATPTKNDWFETVKLNYGVDYQNEGAEHFDPIPDTWTKMFDILNYWTEMGVDGFRCDMAQMVPVAFWHWVIPKVKEINPDILFAAEIYEPHKYQTYLDHGHFDYLYDKVGLYDTLRELTEGSGSTDRITDIWKSQEGISQQMLRFLENHDEQRIASPQFAGDAIKAIPAMVVSATMHTGPVMIYFGQEVGEPGAGVAGFSQDDGRTTHFDYWGVPELQKWVNKGKFDGNKLSAQQKKLREFYSELLNFSSTHPAIVSGGFYDLHFYNRTPSFTSYSDRVYSYLRHHSNGSLLIAVNFSSDTQTCMIKIPEDALNLLGAGDTVYIKAAFNQTGNFEIPRNELVDHGNFNGLRFDLEPFSFEIFTIE